MSLETSTCIGECSLGLNIEAVMPELDITFDPAKLSMKMLI
jgi:hypothetical protein